MENKISLQEVVYEKDGVKDVKVKQPSDLTIDHGTGQLTRSKPKKNRNEKCSCGSGKKFKRCCL
jgi:uncharacterized protein YchJ